MTPALPVALAAALALTACAGTVDTQTASGAAVGGALGAIAATALGANPRELVLGTALGATIGAAAGGSQSAPARTRSDGARCIYPDGRGGSYEAAC